MIVAILPPKRGPGNPRTGASDDLVDLPGTDDMARPAAGRHQHDVETDGAAAMARMLGHEQAGGAKDAAALARRDRLGRCRHAVARFHLDDGERPAAPGDHVDLPGWRAVILRQDAIALEAEPPEGRPFAAPAAAEGGAAVVAVARAAAALTHGLLPGRARARA